MMKKILICLSAALVCLSVAAQNGINQSVEVTNDYKTQMSDLPKGEVGMSVPDSLQEFDYHFDYSVFDSPYKGAYEFSPYFVQMTPDKSVYDGRQFWLRGGAGYSMHPVLDFVWSPVRTPNTSLSIFNGGKGYVGQFFFGRTDEFFSGYDLSDNLSFQADFIGKSSYSKLYGGWSGIFSKTHQATSGYNAFDLNFGVKSRTSSPSFFYYNFDLGYKFASDNIGPNGSVSDHTVSLAGCVGPVIQKKFRLLVDINACLESLHNTNAGMDDYTHFFVGATPHVVFDAGPVHLDAGIAIDYSHSNRDLFSLSPSVKASVSIVKDRIDFYAGLIGGQKMFTYSFLKEFNHFAYAMTPEASQTRYDAFGGFKGSVGTRFDYDLKVGYKVVDNSLTEYPTISYGDISKLYVELSAAWRSDNLKIEGDFSFAPVSALYSGNGYQAPLYKGDVRAVYDWNKRIFAGVTLKLMSMRHGTDPEFPLASSYFSPGVSFEYKLSDSFGVWAEGGNLLGQQVYDVPAYIMQGPYFTIGISCSL